MSSYKIIRAHTLRALEESVNLYLLVDYTPCGGPVKDAEGWGQAVYREVVNVEEIAADNVDPEADLTG